MLQKYINFLLGSSYTSPKNMLLSGYFRLMGHYKSDYVLRSCEIALIAVH